MMNLFKLFKKVEEKEKIKNEIKKVIDTSWKNFKNISEDEKKQETIKLAKNYGFHNEDYLECKIFLKNLYKNY
jgi:uncharacterized protein YigE (DUF2233 family)